MNVRRIRNALCALVFGFAGATAVFSANELRDPRPNVKLGDLNLYRYCESTYGDQSTAMRIADDALGWRCVVREPIFDLREIDMDDACSLEHGVAAEGRTDDVNVPDSWVCYSR